MNKIFLFLIFFVSVGVQYAEGESFVPPLLRGVQLKEICASLDETTEKLVLNELPFNAGLCLGYITSYIDSWFFNVFFTPNKTVCMPDNVSNKQIIAIVKKWLNDHPEKLNEFAHQNISDALRDTFPCSK